jgi:hypothetical protein
MLRFNYLCLKGLIQLILHLGKVFKLELPSSSAKVIHLQKNAIGVSLRSMRLKPPTLPCAQQFD